MDEILIPRFKEYKTKWRRGYFLSYRDETLKGGKAQSYTKKKRKSVQSKHSTAP